MSKKFELVTNFKPSGDQPVAIKELVDGLEAGEAGMTLLGVTGSGKTFTAANVIQTLQRPAVFMAPNKTLAAQLYGEMKDFFPNNAVEYFVSYYDYYQPEAYVPASDTFIEKDSSVNDHIEQMRLSATKALLDRNDVIVIASVSAIYGLGDPDAYLKMILHLDRGEEMNQRELLRKLTSLQYKRNDVELTRGTFRVRGDVIDIYPAESERDAVRVELFDDEVESLAYFDPLTGEVTRKVPRLTIYPSSHYVTSRDTILNVIDDIKDELQERLKQLYDANKLVEAQRIDQRVKMDIEMMVELGYCSGVENYSRYLSGREPGDAPPTLLEYMPKNTIMFIDESHVTVPQIGAMYKGDRSRKETLVEYGFRLPSALDNRPLKFAEFEKLMPQTIYISATPSTYEAEHSGAVVEQVIRPTGLIDPEITIRPVGIQVDDLLSEINETIKKNERILVTTLTKRMSENLTDYYSEHGVRVRYLHSDIDTVERMEILRDLRLGEFDVLIGINLLREGLDLPEVSLVAILDADKEGFLRSERSLIQTIGRAARNVNGRVLMYADKVTKSMKKAIDETDRRREIQKAYNKKNNITPSGIMSAVKDIMEGAYGADGGKKGYFGKVAEVSAGYEHLTPAQTAKRMKNLEQKMYKLAKNMEFEEAAKVRDELRRLQDEDIGI